MANKKKLNKRWIAVVITAALIAAMATMAQCTGNAVIAGNNHDGSSELQANGATEDLNPAKSVSDAHEPDDIQPESSQSDNESNAAQPSPPDAVTSPVAQAEHPSNSQSNTGPGPRDKAPAEPSKTWVIDYVQVWVEDSPAWTEQVTIYGSEEHSICNVCGANITGNESTHAKAHMLAGEGSGHHNEYVQVITSYNTIEHEATGHWETVENGGHWE